MKTKADEGEEELQGGKSLFLRGWLTEAETAEVSTVFHLCALTIKYCFHSGFLTFSSFSKVLALCEEDDVTLHGLVLAAGLTAVARFQFFLCIFLDFQFAQIVPWEQFFSFFLCLSLTSNLHRLCHGSSSPPTTSTSLRACVSTNLRQYCSPAPRNGLYAHK